MQKSKKGSPVLAGEPALFLIETLFHSVGVFPSRS
jgi:hypothetical protein